MAVDNDWRYMDIPQQDLGPISDLSNESAILAPWEFCGGGKSGLREVQKAVAGGECRNGGDEDPADHLAWDALNVGREFADGGRAAVGDYGEDDIVSRFVMTDGGLTLFAPSRCVLYE